MPREEVQDSRNPSAMEAAAGGERSDDEWGAGRDDPVNDLFDKDRELCDCCRVSRCCCCRCEDVLSWDRSASLRKLSAHIEAPHDPEGRPSPAPLESRLALLLPLPATALPSMTRS